jgi:hypothetical protein
MTAQPLPATDALDDYRSTMQAVASGFLQRHWHEHLDDGQLFDRACHYLVVSNEVPVFLAQRLVFLAMSQRPPTVVGVDMASGRDDTLVVLIDPHDGSHHVVPRRILPQQLLAKTFIR